jgi:hypothetical protein
MPTAIDEFDIARFERFQQRTSIESLGVSLCPSTF